ncbi:hypothetical protein JOC77_003532 [Peribacillus deserti]|uniref:Uncharacterized protein n=1 Tax=Peribacillus deserti TaxID=673318 RepID=A0ABS2QNM3_9BACI|nr:hypothetical protein [Peribacillus deserti]MBM7694088.1 hypothetical protein [Peribacillus deserti]
MNFFVPIIEADFRILLTGRRVNTTNGVPLNKILKYKYHGVTYMCFTNNVIEQRANKISEEIRKRTIYQFIKAVSSSGSSPFNTKVILKDSHGVLYSVETNLNGLRFATGELTYKAYKQIQMKETVQGFGSFMVIISSFLIMMWALARYMGI